MIFPAKCSSGKRTARMPGVRVIPPKENAGRTREPGRQNSSPGHISRGIFDMQGPGDPVHLPVLGHIDMVDLVRGTVVHDNGHDPDLAGSGPARFLGERGVRHGFTSHKKVAADPLPDPGIVYGRLHGTFCRYGLLRKCGKDDEAGDDTQADNKQIQMVAGNWHTCRWECEGNNHGVE